MLPGRPMLKIRTCQQISVKPLTTQFHEVRPMGVELFHASRRTDGRTVSCDETKNRVPQLLCESV
jgi:hypothetical protein